MSLDTLAPMKAVLALLKENAAALGVPANRIGIFGELENPAVPYILVDERTSTNRTGPATRTDRGEVEVHVIHKAKQPASDLSDDIAELIEAAEISVAITADGNPSQIERANLAWKKPAPDNPLWEAPPRYRYLLTFAWAQLS